MNFVNLAAVISLIVSVALTDPGASSFSRYHKRALAAETFAQLSISTGTAGNAQAEAQAKIGLTQADIDSGNVSAADLKTLQQNRECAENAEVGTGGFDDTIDTASGADATALQAGKIANKVLKLTLEVAGLQIEQAQGADNQDQIETETAKLNTNVALDKKAAGTAMQTVDFTGSPCA